MSLAGGGWLGLRNNSKRMSCAGFERMEVLAGNLVCFIRFTALAERALENFRQMSARDYDERAQKLTSALG